MLYISNSFCFVYSKIVVRVSYKTPFKFLDLRVLHNMSRYLGRGPDQLFIKWGYICVNYLSDGKKVSM